MADNPDSKLAVTFGIESIQDKAATLKAGRPIFKDREICIIRAPGDRNSEKVFPALSMCGWVTNAAGDQEQITYAQRFNAQYLRFKEGRQQVQEGTPLEEAPFLTQAKRHELKALHIYTVEQLASLDGQPLKNLGMGGRDLKNQAEAYLENATGSATVTKQAAEIEELKRQIAQLQQGQAAQNNAPDTDAQDETAGVSFDAMSDEDLKVFIKDKTGSRPQGNPAHDTLVRMASELATEQAA